MEAEVPDGLILTLPTSLLTGQQDPEELLAGFAEGMGAVNRLAGVAEDGGTRRRTERFVFDLQGIIGEAFFFYLMWFPIKANNVGVFFFFDRGHALRVSLGRQAGGARKDIETSQEFHRRGFGRKGCLVGGREAKKKIIIFHLSFSRNFRLPVLVL